MEYVTATVIAAGQLSMKQKQKQKWPDKIRDKTFWENGYQNWSNQSDVQKTAACSSRNIWAYS